MAMLFPAGHELGPILQKHGFVLPKETVDVHIDMPVDGVIQIVYRCNLDYDDLQRIGKALQDIGQQTEERQKVHDAARIPLSRDGF